MPGRESRRRLSGPDGPSLLGSVDADARVKQEPSSESPFEMAELELNDDEAERQRHREEERAKRESFGRPTPRSGAAVPRATSPFAVMSVRQATALLDKGELGEMYAQCVQLSQHGKINQQNAWQLKLVDYLRDVVSMDRETNFQKASHSIDAASKIYGSRVDSVHKDTFKILSSIHTSGADPRSSNKDGSSLNDGPSSSDGAISGAARRDRNRRVGRATLATSRGQINEDLRNLLVQVDPMFHKTSSAFDEGGARGLLMNQLFIQQGTHIVFDSSTVLDSNAWTRPVKEMTKAKKRQLSDVMDASDESVESKRNEMMVAREMSDDSGSTSADGEDAATEEQWMAELSERCFPVSLTGDGLSSMGNDSDLNAEDGDRDGSVDLSWLTKSDMCPQIETFLQGISEMSKGLSVSALDRAILTAHDPIAAGTGTIRLGDEPTMIQSQQGSMAVGSSGMNTFDQDNGDDPGMDFANFEDLDINADQLFDDDFDVEVHSVMQDRHRAGGAGVSSSANAASSATVDSNLHPRNADLQSIDIQTKEALQTMADQTDATVNLTAMNAFMETLEHDDLEHATAFFDKGWAGPDQWYRRRHQMRLRKQQNLERMKKARNNNNIAFSSSTSALRGNRDESDKQLHPMLERDDLEYDPSMDPSAGSSAVGRKKRGKRTNNADKYIDFMSIAHGNFIEDEKFDPPKRGDNLLSNAALEKSVTLTHRIPNDLHIKPSFFIKMFCKPDYSVWRHWLRTYQARAKAAALSNSSMMMVDHHSSLAVDGQLGPSSMDGGMSTMVEQAEMGRRNLGESVLNSGIGADEIQAAANAAVAIQDDDMDDGFYDYSNPNDQEFVAQMLPDALGAGLSHSNGMMNHSLNHNRNGSPELFSQWDDADFELIAEPNKVEKLTVAFSTKAKKVDVRNLKSKMWERICKMPVKKQPTRMMSITDSSSMEEEKNQESGEYRPFSKVLSGLSSTIEQSQLDVISVPFCFICLLHLANEKGLQFDPVDEDDPMGDFNVFFESETSMVKEESVQDLMILG